MIHPSSIIEPGSRLGADVQVGAFVHIGHPGKDGAAAIAHVGDGCNLRAHGVLYGGARLGERVATGHHWMVREGSHIGAGSLVGSQVTIDDRCTIGERVSMQTGVYVPTGSIIEDDVFLGPRACLTNDKWMGRPAKLEGVTIRRGARIGANATILPGIEIGADALIGSGAVVTRDVVAGDIVLGNPAKPAGTVPQEQRL